MGYEIHTGPHDIRSIGDDMGDSSAHSVDIYVRPPFVPGEGLKRVLGLNDTITIEHIASTEEFTHLYAEVPAGDPDNARRTASIVARLGYYLNNDGKKLTEEYLDAQRTDEL